MANPLQNVKLNPFCRVPLQEPLTCDLLLNESSVELPDRRYLPLLARLGGATSVEVASELAAEALGIGLDAGRAVVRDLIEHQVLVDADTEFPREDKVAFWIERGWMEGLIFHLETRNLSYVDADGAPPGEAIAELLRGAEVEFWKSYPDAPTIDLPPAKRPEGAEPLEQSMLRRRCNRAYRVKELTLEQLGTMLHHGSIGVLGPRLEAEKTYRSHPEKFLSLSSWSAIETYFVAFAVEGLEPGLYHYDLRNHRVALVKPGVTRRELSKCFLGQKISADGACTFLFTAVWQRFMFRYRHPRAFRNLMVNMSELGQRYLLMATALGLSTYMTPQSLYRETQKILGVPHFEEGLVYAVGVG